MSGQVAWQLLDARATLRLERCAAHLDLTNPGRGLEQFTIDGTQVDPRLRTFAVCLPDAPEPARLTESYLRGPDLIATYRVADTSRFRVEIYWRDQTALYPGALAALELMISLQTSLLESRPRLTVSSLIPAAAAWRCAVAGPGAPVDQPLACPPRAVRAFTAADGSGCFRLRVAQSGWDYAELVHPADFESSSLAGPGAAGDSAASDSAATCLTHRLFEQSLEKGVILRSRLLGLFLPSDAASATIADCYRTFAGQKLPLSA